jgi:hypothetical protein
LTVYLNAGPKANVPFSFQSVAKNGGKPIADRYFEANSIVIMADIDGDGRADFNVINVLTGSITTALNNGASPSANKWRWLPQGEIKSGALGVLGVNIRLADLDGDGKADFIYLTDTGLAKVSKNNYIRGQVENLNWHPSPNSSIIVGAPRHPGFPGFAWACKDVFFADMNGDGKADYLWLDPITGGLRVWINHQGEANNAWIEAHVEEAHGVPKASYPLQQLGASVYFGDMTHSGRADYLVIPFLDKKIIEAWSDILTYLPKTFH